MEGSTELWGKWLLQGIWECAQKPTQLESVPLGLKPMKLI